MFSIPVVHHSFANHQPQNTFIPSRMTGTIDSTKLQKELGWEPSLQFEEGIEKTVRWYLDNQEWLDNITSGDYQKYYEEMYGER